jgi:hypothetical protein
MTSLNVTYLYLALFQPIHFSFFLLYLDAGVIQSLCDEYVYHWASELSIIIWKAIEKLRDWGFSVDYIMQDGGEENRNFMSMHFRGNANEMLYGSPNLVNL